MLLWKNTKTLDGFINDISQTNDKEVAEIALLGSKSINLSEFPKLKGIFRVGVSSTNIPTEEALNRTIQVCFPSERTKNYIYEETANFTCGLIFKANYSNLGTLKPWVKHNRMALSEKVLLVIGEGRIGGMVKNKMTKFLHVLVYDPEKYPYIKIKPLLEKADFVSIHISDTDDNQGMFDAEKMSYLKNNAVIINTARGRVVDENALFAELHNNRLSAAFDVYWEEPYQGILTKFYPDRFNMTPHVASTCNEFLEGSEKDFRIFIAGL